MSVDRSPTDAFWTVYISIDNALDQVLKTMPDITDQREIEDGEPGKRLNPSLVLARSYVHSAVIVLHSVESENNALAYERCLAASRSMARDVELVGDVSFIYAHACLGVRYALSEYSGLSILNCSCLPIGAGNVGQRRRGLRP